MSPPTRLPQVPPVCRAEPYDPYSTVDLAAATAAQRERIRAHLLFSANTGDPAAYLLPSYEQAKLSAT
ncbi:hypothetical protein ABT061_29065 [Streptosporangium sp. NPDC002544]|uniref:hypothetical protein n=1 Tax=Streptosporangium sp. NPDC002544 TaxID=3154538 RepID=UPI00332E80EF